MERSEWYGRDAGKKSKEVDCVPIRKSFVQLSILLPSELQEFRLCWSSEKFDNFFRLPHSNLPVRPKSRPRLGTEGNRKTKTKSQIERKSERKERKRVLDVPI